MLSAERELILDEFLRDKALGDHHSAAATPERRHTAEVRAVVDRSSAEQTLVYMQRDLEKANDTIRVLQGERRTQGQMKLLYEEARSEKNQLQKEAVQAATEAETLRRTLSDLQEKMRLRDTDTTAQEQITQRFFETEEKFKAMSAENAEKEASWLRERTILLQQVDQVNEIRDSITSAYERGRRAAENEVEHHATSARAERDDLKRSIERLESDAMIWQGEKQRLAERVALIPELEMAINDLRTARNTERSQHATDHTRLREDLARFQRESEDWHAAYQTAEKHKKAMQFQLEDVKTAYNITLQERASLEARLELLQVQINDSRLAKPYTPM